MLTKIYAALMIVLAMIGGTSSPQQTIVPNTFAKANNVQNEVSAQSEPISQSQAEEIALQAFELQREDVLLERTELDYEKGQPVWEVEFHYQQSEYELEIHAKTGEILRAKPQIQPSEEQQQPTEELTKEQAISVALSHAGLSEEHIKRLKVEKDRDRGAWVYEIEFQHGIVEYEYEIRISDGKILEWNKEIDD